MNTEDGSYALRLILVERRRALGMSQAELARRMGTSQSNVSELEAGSIDARLSTWVKWARAVGLTLDVTAIEEIPHATVRFD